MSAENEKKTESKAPSFKDFVTMHGAMCAIYLGQMPNPADGKTVHNLPAVQETIGLLEMFREKTKGNLDKDEEKILGDTIYALQMAYVQAIQAGVPSGPPEREEQEESPIAKPKTKIYTPYDA